MTTDIHSTRARILRAAEPLFARSAFSRVTMRAIAAASGVHLGALPYHFGTKEQLYRSIWVDWQTKLDASQLFGRMRNTRRGDDLEASLRTLVEAFFAGPRELLRDQRGRYFVAIMVREAQDPAGQERKLLQEIIHPNRDWIRQEIQQLFPKMSSLAFATCFEMMISALRVVIERDDLSAARQDAKAANAQFDVLTEFIVSGWLAAVSLTSNGPASSGQEN